MSGSVMAAETRKKLQHASNRDDWETPPEVFAAYHAVFRFTLDACATERTAKCPRYFTREQDGLAQDWSGDIVWCNPPYGRDLPRWLAKARDEAQRGATVVCLIFARTETRYWHDIVKPHANEIHYLRGRLRFLLDGVRGSSAPHGSAVVVFRPPVALAGAA